MGLQGNELIKRHIFRRDLSRIKKLELKLWEKQKKGKKKMKQLGDITIPQNAFLEVLKM